MKQEISGLFYSTFGWKGMYREQGCSCSMESIELYMLYKTCWPVGKLQTPKQTNQYYFNLCLRFTQWILPWRGWCIEECALLIL